MVCVLDTRFADLFFSNHSLVDRFFILCVLRIRRSVLPMSWGDVCDSICLTVWVTHDPFTAVRATTSLGVERAQ